MQFAWLLVCLLISEFRPLEMYIDNYVDWFLFISNITFSNSSTIIPITPYQYSLHVPRHQREGMRDHFRDLTFNYSLLTCEPTNKGAKCRISSSESLAMCRGCMFTPCDWVLPAVPVGGCCLPPPANCWHCRWHLRAVADCCWPLPTLAVVSAGVRRPLVGTRPSTSATNTTTAATPTGGSCVASATGGTRCSCSESHLEELNGNNVAM